MRRREEAGYLVRGAMCANVAGDARVPHPNQHHSCSGVQDAAMAV